MFTILLAIIRRRRQQSGGIPFSALDFTTYPVAIDDNDWGIDPDQAIEIVQ